MASIRQLPSGRFNVQIRRKNAAQISRSFDTQSAAQEWIKEQESLPPEEPNPSLLPSEFDFLVLARGYCKTVLTNSNTRTITQGRLERIAPRIPRDVRLITKFDVNKYRLARLEEVKPATCREELQLIHRVFRWAHRELLLDAKQHPSPCKEVPIPAPSKPRSRVIDHDELELLMSALSPVMRHVVELAFETAMRRGEIVKLQVKHLHLEDRYLSVIDGKTGDRSVPLTNRAVELLRGVLKDEMAQDARLFPITPHSVSTAVRRARKKVELDDGVRLHQLRHTRITNVAKKGLNQAQIMIVSGHRDVRSVQRYTHLSVKDVVQFLD